MADDPPPGSHPARAGRKIRPGTRPSKDPLVAKRQQRADRARDLVRDRRRFKDTPVPTGTVSKRAPESSDGTIFPRTVRRWTPGTAETILKDGALNSKIGGDVQVGDLRGARIYTLSLEERATCPRSCPIWAGCYGNNMQFARRWSPDAAFEAALADEVRAVCAAHPLVLIRLHVLGDFYSFDYLALWVGLLDDLPNLNVFGFTAHGPDTQIGAGIARVRQALGRRFSIRHSGRAARWGSLTIDFPTDKRMIGDAVVCPEQRDAMRGKGGRHCANCAVCWQTDRAIVFIEH